MEENRTEPIEYGKGLTWRSAIALIYAALVFMPACIWLNLAAGMGVAAFTIIQYTVLIFVSEMAYYFGSPLTKQEATVIWTCAAVAGGDIIAIYLVNFFYFRTAPEMWSLTAPGTTTPLPLAIPDWFAPPVDSPAAVFPRTLLLSQWIVPSALFVFELLIFWRLLALATGLLAFQLFVVEEKLPFPMQQVAADVCLTLTERKPEKTRILTISTLLGLIYAFFVYGPSLMSAFRIPPILWLDINKFIERWMPGASFGLSIDLIQFSLGFILPLPVVVSMFAGSLALYFYGNWLLVQLFPAKEGQLSGLFGWSPGMSVGKCYQWSVLYVWAGPIIGLAIAAGLLPMLRRPRTFVRALGSLRRITGEAKQRGSLPIWLIILVYVASVASMVGVTHLLVPGFPVWILALLVGLWPLASAFIGSRMLGEAGVSVGIPYLKESMYLASGYTNVDIWFAPVDRLPMIGVISGFFSGPVWCGYFKVCELTETNLMDFVKAFMLATLISWSLSMFYVTLFWQMIPIPRGFPAASVFWPTNAMLSSLWITRSFQILRPEIIVGGALIGAALSLAFGFAHIPFSLAGFTAGCVSLIPYAATIFVGGLVGVLLARAMGTRAWTENRVTIVAGLSIGEGLAVCISAAISLIIKALLIVPY